MNKYRYIFNYQTLAVAILSLAISYLSLAFHFSSYIDFLILGLLLVFPLTLTIKEAFKRSERAIQYLSLFKASLQSVNDCFENSKPEELKKREIETILVNLSDQ